MKIKASAFEYVRSYSYWCTLHLHNFSIWKTINIIKIDPIKATFGNICWNGSLSRQTHVHKNYINQRAHSAVSVRHVSRFIYIDGIKRTSSRPLALFFDRKILKVAKKIFPFDDRLKSGASRNNFVFIKAFCLHATNVIHIWVGFIWRQVPRVLAVHDLHAKPTCII